MRVGLLAFLTVGVVGFVVPALAYDPAGAYSGMRRMQPTVPPADKAAEEFNRSRIKCSIPLNGTLADSEKEAVGAALGNCPKRLKPSDQAPPLRNKVYR